MAARITGAFPAAAVANDVPFFLHVRIGAPAHEILDLAKQLGADLLFMELAAPQASSTSS